MCTIGTKMRQGRAMEEIKVCQRNTEDAAAAALSVWGYNRMIEPCY